MEETGKFVYVGLRPGSDKPLVCVWHRIKDDGTADGEDSIAFAPGRKRNLLTTQLIGAIGLIEKSTDTGYRMNEEPTEVWPDESDVDRWHIETQTARTVAEIRKRQGKRDYGALTLSELKEMYGKTIGRSNRAALLAVIQQFVTG